MFSNQSLTEMHKTCNFCLEFSVVLFKITNIDIKDLLRTVFPYKNTNNFENTYICMECLNSLKSTYNFTKSAKEINHKLCNQTTENLCQTCLTPVDNATVYLFDHFDNAIPYYEIKEMLDYSSLDLDTENQRCPVLCNTCWEKLKKSYHFLKKYAENERRATQFNNGNSFTESNIYKQAVKRICEIKMEVEDYFVKEEPPDDVIIEDNFPDTPIRHNESLGTNFRSNIVYIKEERGGDDFRKELYIKLEKMDMGKLGHGTHKKSQKSAQQCHLCPFTTQRTYTYLRHMTTHMNLDECIEHNTLFQCHNCPYRAKRRYSLIRHLKTVHMPTYVCKKCRYSTDTSESLKLHVDTKHNNSPVPYTCEKCPHVAKSKSELRQHSQIHDLHNTVLKCGQCDFESKEITCLNKHRMCHRNKVGKLYKCEICSYQVKKKSNMDRHVLTHFSRKQLSGMLYACPECHYKTKRKDSLPIHIRKKHKSKA